MRSNARSAGRRGGFRRRAGIGFGRGLGCLRRCRWRSDGEGKDAAVERAIGFPLLAVVNTDAVVESAKPDAPGFVADEGTSVIVAKAVFYR